MAELVTFTHTASVLQEYAEAVEALYRDKLIEKGHNASYNLLQSVHTEVKVGDRSVAVDMTLADYWKYIEYDTKPHIIPLDALLKWVKIKPILPVPDANGRIPTPKQLAFLIGRKIAREGTKGTHSLEESVRYINAQYESKIADAITADIGDAASAIITTFARV